MNVAWSRDSGSSDGSTPGIGATPESEVQKRWLERSQNLNWAQVCQQILTEIHVHQTVKSKCLRCYYLFILDEETEAACEKAGGRGGDMKAPSDSGGKLVSRCWSEPGLPSQGHSWHCDSYHSGDQEYLQSCRG